MAYPVPENQVMENTINKKGPMKAILSQLTKDSILILANKIGVVDVLFHFFDFMTLFDLFNFTTFA